MKRICEIYDVSKDYEMPTGTVLIIVSDIEKDKIISILLNTKLKEIWFLITPNGKNILKLTTNINVTKLNIKCEKLGNRKGLRVMFLTFMKLI